MAKASRSVITVRNSMELPEKSGFYVASLADRLGETTQALVRYIPDTGHWLAPEASGGRQVGCWYFFNIAGTSKCKDLLELSEHRLASVLEARQAGVTEPELLSVELRPVEDATAPSMA